MRKQLPALVLALAWAFISAGAQPRSVVVDASKVRGRIRSLQGVNLGPLHSQPSLPDLSVQYRDLGIDIIRAHDFFGPTDIDAHPKDRGHEQVIFPDWNADHDFTLLEQRGGEGAELELHQPLAAPAVELIVVTAIGAP